MRSLLLLFNTPEEKMPKLRVLCMRLGIKMRPVSPEQYSLTIGQLAEGKTELEEPMATEEVFTDEMAVMCGFNNTMIDDFLMNMRRQRIQTIPLKAVLTQDNSAWDCYKLHRELSAEHEAMKKGLRAHESK